MDQQCPLEVSESHIASVGRFEVRRALPRRGRRTVGPWCFADHMGPADVDEQNGLDVGPHPHIGLQTVTWLIDGQLLHKDSLGSEQVLRPGQLNLMTAGHGIVHSEESTGSYRGTLEGIQLWIAQPDATREGGAGFTHHDELPQFDVKGGSLTVLIGTHHGEASLVATSPAVTAHPAIGMELALTEQASIPLDPAFEHAVIPLRGGIEVFDERIGPGQSAYLPVSTTELSLRPNGASTVMVIGGLPFGEAPLMWWNFVGRTREEIVDAYGSWQADDRERFGAVNSRLNRIETSGPPW